MVSTLNYKIKSVSPKYDMAGKLYSYSIIVCSKTNEDFITSFNFTVEDIKTLGINNLDQAMALVGQSCTILKTLKLS